MRFTLQGDASGPAISSLCGIVHARVSVPVEADGSSKAQGNTGMFGVCAKSDSAGLIESRSFDMGPNVPSLWRIEGRLSTGRHTYRARGEAKATMDHAASKPDNKAVTVCMRNPGITAATERTIEGVGKVWVLDNHNGLWGKVAGSHGSDGTEGQKYLGKHSSLEESVRAASALGYGAVIWHKTSEPNHGPTWAGTSYSEGTNKAFGPDPDLMLVDSTGRPIRFSGSRAAVDAARADTRAQGVHVRPDGIATIIPTNSMMGALHARDHTMTPPSALTTVVFSDPKLGNLAPLRILPGGLAWIMAGQNAFSGLAESSNPDDFPNSSGKLGQKYLGRFDTLDQAEEEARRVGASGFTWHNAPGFGVWHRTAFTTPEESPMETAVRSVVRGSESIAGNMTVMFTAPPTESDRCCLAQRIKPEFISAVWPNADLKPLTMTQCGDTLDQTGHHTPMVQGREVVVFWHAPDRNTLETVTIDVETKAALEVNHVHSDRPLDRVLASVVTFGVMPSGDGRRTVSGNPNVVQGESLTDSVGRFQIIGGGLWRKEAGVNWREGAAQLAAMIQSTGRTGRMIWTRNLGEFVPIATRLDAGTTQR
tara:strand:- start:164 stop:1942 length:1779 start_codon:yes stop_codon:yes gene_type:complete